MQDADAFVSPRSNWTVVTRRAPTDDEWRDLVLAWRVCGRTTSNAIAVVTAGQAVGVGAGQQSRVVAAEIAVQKAGERAKGGAGASDAFFPFPDGLVVLADAGVTAVVQPGGSVRGRRSHRRGGRGRSGHGDDRRTALQALMSAILLDGEAVAARIRSEVADRAAVLAAEGVHVGLGTILVGDDAPSARYVAMKHEDCAELGIYSVGEHLPATATQEEVMEAIARFNADPKVSAFLVQLPLPDGPRRGACPARRRPGQGRRRPPSGQPRVDWCSEHRGRCPCTPAGIVELLHAYDVPVEGRHVVIIGRGVTIGRPLANLLTLKRPGYNAAVTVVHTGVAPDDMARQSPARADIVVAAAGRPHLLTPDMVRSGAAVVSAGTTFEGRKLIPDAHPDVAEVAGYITPRLGGVGPMTRAMLLRNAVRLARGETRPAEPGKTGTVGAGARRSVPGAATRC